MNRKISKSGLSFIVILILVGVFIIKCPYRSSDGSQGTIQGQTPMMVIPISCIGSEGFLSQSDHQNVEIIYLTRVPNSSKYTPYLINLQKMEFHVGATMEQKDTYRLLPRGVEGYSEKTPIKTKLFGITYEKKWLKWSGDNYFVPTGISETKIKLFTGEMQVYKKTTNGQALLFSQKLKNWYENDLPPRFMYTQNFNYLLYLDGVEGQSGTLYIFDLQHEVK